MQVRIRGREMRSMTYLGDTGVLLAALTTVAGTGAGWMLRSVLFGRSREGEEELRRQCSTVREETLALRVELEAARERLLVREREIAELQSLLSLAEEEKERLQGAEPQLQG